MNNDRKLAFIVDHLNRICKRQGRPRPDVTLEEMDGLESLDQDTVAQFVRRKLAEKTRTA